MSFLQRLPKCNDPLKNGWPWTEETSPSVYAAAVQWPRISIVTPSFNQGAYIEETLRSILLQNYPNLEFVVIDGGSSDITVDILKKYEPYLTYWESKKDRGQTHALNKGIQRLTGEIFNWVNSDDLLLPNALVEVAKAYINAKNCAVFCFSTLYFDEKNNRTRNGMNILGQTVYETLCKPSINQLGTFWKFRMVQQLRGLNEDFHYVMDLDLWLRYLLLFSDDLKSIYRQDTPIGLFRLHDQSKTIAEEKKSTLSKFEKEKFILYKNLSNIGRVSNLLEGYMAKDTTLNQKQLRGLYNSFCYYAMIRAFYKEEYSLVKLYAKKIDYRFLKFAELRDVFHIVRKSIFNG
jgi:glycosyltransferase involved in cell wall biosynthesis